MKKTNEELLKELEEFRIVNSQLQTKILELEESQKDLKEISDRWQFAIEGADDGVWDWNAKTNIVFFSKKWKSMFGYEEHEIGNSLEEWDKRIYPEDKKQCHEDLEKHFNKETPIYKNEHRVLCKDGSYKWILDRGKVVEWDEEGKPLRVVGTHVDITSRKQIELALQESESRFKSMFEKHNAIMLLVEPATGLIIDANDSACNFYAYSKSQLCGMYITEINALPPERVALERQKAIEEKRNYFIFPHKLSTGEERIVEVHSSPIEVQKKKILFSIIQDITERMQLESDLFESEKKLKAIFDILNVGISITDEMGNIIDCNKASERILGITKAEHLARNYAGYEWKILRSDLSIMPPEEYASVRAMKEKRSIVDAEMGVQRPDGTISWIIVNATPLNLHNYGVVISFVDITDLKKNEQETKLLSTERQTILNNMGSGVFFLKNRIVIWANQKAEKIYGYSLEEITGESTLKFYLNEDDYTRFGVEAYSALAQGKLYSFEMKQKKKTGEEFWCSLVGQAINPNNLDEGSIWITEDITERKQLENTILESELKFRTVADFTYDWEYWINEKDEIVYISPSCERITGYLPEDFLNDTTLLNTIIHPEDFTLMENHLRKFHTLAGRNEIETFDFRIIKKDSSILYINHVCRPVFDQNNKYIGRRASNRDITERLRMDEKIKQQNKELLDANASKDKFFSIIAHDLKGPFNGFLGLTAMMQEPDINLEEMRNIGSMLNTSANNVYRLLENLLTWARIQRGAIEFSPVIHNLSSTAIQSINILSETAKQKEIDIIESIPKHLEAFADSSMLDTIFRNLITNSIKFTKRGGKITVSAKENDIEIIIQVQDTGIGMNEKILEGLFKIDQKIARPGTERETSTGLGLLLCKEFVEIHKGKIWAISEVDKGSSFYFTLNKKNSF